MKRFSLAVVLLVLINSCSSIKQQTQQNLQSGYITSTPVVMTEMMRCQSLFEKTCQQCHKLPDPTSRTDEKWNSVLPVMAGKAKIDEVTKDSIAKYIFAMRRGTK